MALYRLDGYIPEIDKTAFVAPTADIIGNVRIRSSASVWFNAVLRGDVNSIYVGENTNIQDLTLVHVDPDNPVHIGKNVTVGHSAVIHGCTVEDGCLIGIGAKVLNNAVIGRGSIVAAGSIVLENTIIPPNSMVTGIPGMVKKELAEDMQTVLGMMVDVYVEKSQIFANEKRFVRIVPEKEKTK